MKRTLLFFAIVLTTEILLAQAVKDKTAFQTGSAWRPEIDVRSDIAIIYGANDHRDLAFSERVNSWRDRGYRTDFMTGIAWGEYADYFLGKWDGQNHMGIGQVQMNGDTIWHNKGVVPYIVPVKSFIEYMKNAVIKKVIDAGITDIFLEEPEFWARAGYEDPFKLEWQNFYGFPWRAQHISAENTYLSNKLKYQLYYNAIKEVSSFAKEYGKNKGIVVKVFIATHSLVNYASWKIVSPEASLASLPSIDGYIAQVWTGTAREPVFFNGMSKERVFENAFLEYGSMVSMTAPTKRKLFFLTDPIEDRARDWADYKRNYEATFTAKLLYPMVADYEVMPWPERIYTHPYQVANSTEKALIPKYYSTQMQVMVNSLNDISVSPNKVSGANGIGVLMGNSLMFQSYPSHNGYDDPYFSNFYGQTIPLLKQGIPVQTVHMENLQYAATLKDIKVLILSYSNMKPANLGVHKYLAEWVRKGGILIYCGRDDDPYQTVMEWWNTNGLTFKSPSAHLFNLLNIKVSSDTAQIIKIGNGTVHIIRKNPKEFIMNAGGAVDFLSLVKQAYENEARAGRLIFKNSLVLHRGPYDIISVMNESSSSESYIQKGMIIDLFDPKLPVLKEKIVAPGEQAYLYNIDRVSDKTKPQVLASAARIYDQIISDGKYSFLTKSPVNTINSMRILLPAKAKAISISNSNGTELTDINHSWDSNSKTLYVGFPNDPEGISVKISY